MSLKTNTMVPEIGVQLSEAYTKITEISVEASPVFRRPDVEGEEPTLVSNHRIRFRTNTFVSEIAKSNGASPIASHGYTVPFNYESGNILPYLYSWLKSNITMFNNAIDV